MDPITVTRRTQFSAKHAEQFRAIYLDNFPPHERADFSYLLDSIAQGGRWFFAATRGNDLVGFAIIVPQVASDVHLLEYLAVARESRNSGIGGTLRMKLLWLAIDANVETPRGVKLRECVVGIYAKCYGLREDDTLVQEMVRQVAR